MSGPTALPTEPAPILPAAETSPLALLVAAHAEAIVTLQNDVTALQKSGASPVAAAAAAVSPAAIQWLHDRIAELYGNAGLHLPVAPT
jgi:hypothetical protein